MALQADNTLEAEIFDYLIIPSYVFGDKVTFGIQSNSTHPRFRKIFFRTRRPIEEFRDLCEFIASRYPNIILPVLPFEEALPDEDRDDLTRKRAQLHDFFKDLLQIPDVFNDPCMPLFIQTHMPMGKIKEQIAQQEAGSNEEQIKESNDQVAGNVNDQQVVADNEQQLAANNNNQQVLENRDGDQPFDGENAARGNASESETDEPIFHMEDIE